jgi:hypothetical protein
MKLKHLVISILFAGVLCLSVFAVYRWGYPYGRRTAFLPCMVHTLILYARDNGETFPDGKDSFEALLKLHPRYLEGATELLAGLSGDRAGVIRKVRSGAPLGSNDCSWVYHPGFLLSDDPRIAIVWERHEGIRFNGGRCPGHAVGFIDGSHLQVPPDAWREFISDQEARRSAALALRRENK